MGNLNAFLCFSLFDYLFYPSRYLGGFPHVLYYSARYMVPIYSYSLPPVLIERIHPRYYRAKVLYMSLWEVNANFQSPVGRLEYWSGHHYHFTLTYVLESDEVVALPRVDEFGNPLPRRYGFSMESLDGFGRINGKEAEGVDLYVCSSTGIGEPCSGTTIFVFIMLNGIQMEADCKITSQYTGKDMSSIQKFLRLAILELQWTGIKIKLRIYSIS